MIPATNHRMGGKWGRYHHPIKLAKTLYQRARYGVSYQDVWSLDYYLNHVISNGLVKLAEQSHTWPPQAGFETHQDWVAELQFRANQFALLANDEYVSDYHDAATALRKEAYEWLVTHHDYLWD